MTGGWGLCKAGGGAVCLELREREVMENTDGRVGRGESIVSAYIAYIQMLKKEFEKMQ